MCNITEEIAAVLCVKRRILRRQGLALKIPQLQELSLMRALEFLGCKFCFDRKWEWVFLRLQLWYPKSWPEQNRKDLRQPLKLANPTEASEL